VTETPSVQEEGYREQTEVEVVGGSTWVAETGDSPPRQGRGGGGARSGVCGGGVLDLWCASQIRERERATLQLIPSYLLADADELLFREK
jgi:hypothetical protein